MARPYKEVHDMLLAAIGAATNYSDDWKAISTDLDKLLIRNDST